MESSSLPDDRGVRLSHEDLLKAYRELDDNSKILVQTDFELHKAKNEVETQVNQLLLLNKISDAIHASQEKHSILKMVCESLVSGIGFEKAWVLYYEKDSTQPLFVQHGASLSERPQLLQIAQRGLLNQADQTDPFIMNIDHRDTDENLRGLLLAIQCSQMMQVPLRGRRRIVGGIFAARIHSYPAVTDKDASFFLMLARQVAIALDNAELNAEITANNQALEERVALRSKELMEANTRLLELDRVKSNFISLVSHELRTPMTSIKGFSALLIEFEEKMGTEQRRGYLRKISEESDRLSRLISDLLDISRIESGRIVLRWSEFDLAQLVEQVFEKQRLIKLSIHYRLKVAPGLPRFAADRDKLYEVILNLVANASRFTPSEGTVTVVADPYEEGLRFRVSNPGEGIPFDQLSKIFDKFYRMENDINRKNPGTGLGLSISRGLVDLHGGKIWADSELHKQTTFTLLLPLNLDKLPAPQVEREPKNAA